MSRLVGCETIMWHWMLLHLCDSLLLQHGPSVGSWGVTQNLWLQHWTWEAVVVVGKIQAMWATAVPCAPTLPAPGALPVPAVVTWLTTLQCRASRTCSSSTAVQSLGPQLNPALYPRPQYLGMPAFTRKAMCSVKAVHQSTCTAVCSETLISAPSTMSFRRVLYLEPGPSLTTSFSTYRPPAHTLERAPMPLHSPRLGQTNTLLCM